MFSSIARRSLTQLSSTPRYTSIVSISFINQIRTMSAAPYTVVATDSEQPQDDMLHIAFK
jgi:hypothetical protein